MGKYLFFIVSLLACAGAARAQHYAVIDTKYILSKLPEYDSAQRKLDAFSIAWQAEIDRKASELQKMRSDYDAEQVMLSDDLKKKEGGPDFQPGQRTQGSST